jgi:signal transduction histidine kinase
MKWLRGPEDDAARAYRAELRAERMGAQVRMAALVIATINTFFIGLDFYAFHEHFADFLWARLALNLALAVSYFHFARTRPLVGEAVICVSTGAMLLVVIYSTNAPISDYYVGLVLFVIGIPVLLPLSGREVALVSIPFAIAYGVSPLVIGGSEAGGDLSGNAARQDFTVHCFFLAGATLLGIASSYLLDRFRFTDFMQRRVLESARDELRELDRAKSRFSANVHHELRTPLTLILSPLEALLGGEFGEVVEAQRVYLETMRTNAQRLLRLINNLLDVSKIESQQLRLHRRPLQVARVLEDLVAGARPLAKHKRVQMTVCGLEDVPEINADLDAVEKVLLNLLGNAVKFTRPGGRIEVAGAREDGGVRITVSDDGIGIPEDELDRIFDRFAQVDGSATRHHEGTGIGLCLAKELVELHGGRIWAESEGPGCGARFCFTLPRGEVDPSEEEDAPVAKGEDAPGFGIRNHELEAEAGAPIEEAEIRGASDEDERPRTSETAGRAAADSAASRAAERRRAREMKGRPRIVVVEDNAEMLRFLAAILEPEYNVRTASNGREGLDAAREARPDLVVTDVMMPEMSGTDLCRELEGDAKTRGTPVLLLTAKADREMKVEGLELGARDYVTKPFHPKELLARVRSIVQIEQLQRKLGQRNAILESTIYELKQTEVQLVQAERLAAVGELAAGVAHEVNNPVNFAINSLQTLRLRVEEVRQLLEVVAEIDPRTPEGLSDRLEKLARLEEEIGFSDLVSELDELVAIATDGLERTHRLVGDLHNFAGHGTAVRSSVDVRNGLGSTIRLMHRAAQDVGAEVESEYDSDLPAIESSASVLNQVFLNLLKNATEALATVGGGTIRVTAKHDVRNAEIAIVIADDGPGIDPKIRHRLFDPFVSTKSAGKGAGLGLSVCRRILGELGGKIEVLPTGGRGAAFEIRLPTGEAEAA